MNHRQPTTIMSILQLIKIFENDYADVLLE